MHAITAKLTARDVPPRPLQTFAEGLDDEELQLTSLELVEPLIAKLEECSEVLAWKVPLVSTNDVATRALRRARTSATYAASLLKLWYRERSRWVSEVCETLSELGVAVGVPSLERLEFSQRLSPHELDALAVEVGRRRASTDKIGLRLAIFCVTLWPQELRLIAGTETTSDQNVPRDTEPISDAVDHLRQRLEGTSPQWIGWDTIDRWLADLSALGEKKREAREAPWRALRETWRAECQRDLLPELWEGHAVLLPDAWRGDMAAVGSLLATLSASLDRGASALHAQKHAQGRTERRRATDELDAIEASIEDVFARARSLFDTTSPPDSGDATGPRSEVALPAPVDAVDEPEVASNAEVEVPTATTFDPPLVAQPEQGDGSTLAETRSAEALPAAALHVLPVDPISREDLHASPPTRTDGSSPDSSAPATSGVREVNPIQSSPSVPLRSDGSSTATLTPAPPPSPQRPPPWLLSYDAFREAMWIAPDGRCEPAPWLRPDFVGRLHARVGALLDQEVPDLRWLSIFARGGESLHMENLATPDDVQAIVALWRTPDSSEAGTCHARSARLRRSLVAAEIGPSATWRWRILLEVLRPAREQPLTKDEVEDCCELAGITSAPLRDLLFGIAKLNVGGEEGALEVRRALRAQETGDLAGTTQELARTRVSFYQEVTSRWSAGGGSIMTTHCRKAWARFMEDQGANLKRLFPVANGGSALDVPADRRWVDALPSAHAAIADAEHALHGDRARMDRMVGRFQGNAARILDLVERLETKHARPGRLEVTACCNAAKNLKSDGNGPVGERGITAFALACLGLTTLPEVDATAFALPDVLQAPWLLRYLGVAEVPRGGSGTAVRFDLGDVRDPRRASAALLAAPTPNGPVASGLPGLVHWIEASEQSALLSPLTPMLEPQAQQRTHVRRQQALAKLEQLSARLERSRHHLADLAHPTAFVWKGALEDALAWLHPENPDRGLPNDLSLFQEWLERACTEAQGACDDAVADLHEQGRARGSLVAAAVDDALRDLRFADALRALDRVPTEETERRRESVWRWEARTLYSEPRSSLERFEGAREFVLGWLQGIQPTPGPNQRLRTLFRDLMLPGLDPPSERNELRVECQQIRQWLAQQGQNPSALPQLTASTALVVVTPTHPPNHTGFVQALATQVAPHARDLVAVLAPKVTHEVRARALTEFRNRRYRAALVDDLDLCRLLNPGGPRPVPVVALLEVILEQQRWSDASPFSLSDGQSVQVEMYFGRAEEARRLSHERGVSRLFSGRKLGKSALLRFVEQTEDGQRLPSGNTLRVVYVSAAGVDGERAMVGAILDALQQRCSVAIAPELPDEDPPTRIERALRRHLDGRPNESLLFFLDEADVFVEQQLRDYAERAERTLSFVMRSRLESLLDAASFPRVRFVFTGYRVTNTTRGAWGNWGDTLRLRPLDAASAADLIARPLARLGIDASDQARAIAYRCGFQPAVLLRFGQHLLTRMSEIHPALRRDQSPIVVTPADVSEVFDSDAVRTEIVQVTKNNFQGNEAGEIVHALVLLEFVSLPPGRALEDAGRTVLASLERLSDGDVGWFVPEGSTAEAEIAHHLRDLVDRQLLVPRNEGHALRFPHLLPVLLPLADERQIRQRIDLRRKGSVAAPGTTAVEGALAERDIEEIREDLRASTDGALSVVPIVASHWLAPLVDRRVGLADRLGLAAEDVIDALATPPPGPARTTVMVVNADPDYARALVRHTLDLRRLVLVGGVDLLRWAPSLGASRESTARESLADVFCDGRWSVGRVRWWFQRVRTFEFEPADAIERLHQTTGGIPLLLARFDELLCRDLGFHDGETLSASDWQRATTLFDNSIRALARSLVEGPPSVRLTARELELLQMLASVRDAETPETIAEHLTDLWEYYRGSLPTAPVGPDEWSSVEILQRLGLAPAAARGGSARDRLALIPADDPIRRLLANVGG